MIRSILFWQRRYGAKWKCNVTWQIRSKIWEALSLGKPPSCRSFACGRNIPVTARTVLMSLWHVKRCRNKKLILRWTANEVYPTRRFTALLWGRMKPEEMRWICGNIFFCLKVACTVRPNPCSLFEAKQQCARAIHLILPPAIKRKHVRSGNQRNVFAVCVFLLVACYQSCSFPHLGTVSWQNLRALFWWKWRLSRQEQNVNWVKESQICRIAGANEFEHLDRVRAFDTRCAYSWPISARWLKQIYERLTAIKRYAEAGFWWTTVSIHVLSRQSPNDTLRLV